MDRSLRRVYGSRSLTVFAIATAAPMQESTVMLFHDEARPSHVVLPVVDIN